MILRIGIDSGLLGAFAFLMEGPSGKLDWDIRAMPLNSEGLIDGFVLTDILRVKLLLPTSSVRVSLESINVAFSKEKRKQANVHIQLMEFGKIRGVLESLGIKYDLIAPISWQTAAGKKDLSNKEESIVKAIELYPEIQPMLLNGGSKTTYSDGKAEAVLIVHHQLVQEAKTSKKRRSSNETSRPTTPARNQSRGNRISGTDRSP
jgi:hypothetical protein